MKKAANRTASIGCCSNHRDLMDAEFVLNADAGGVTTDERQSP